MIQDRKLAKLLADAFEGWGDIDPDLFADVAEGHACDPDDCNEDHRRDVSGMRTAISRLAQDLNDGEGQ